VPLPDRPCSLAETRQTDHRSKRKKCGRRSEIWVVQRLRVRRRFNYDGLADVIKVSGVAQVDVPVYLVVGSTMALN
jgi:hypothetical protein